MNKFWAQESSSEGEQVRVNLNSIGTNQFHISIYLHICMSYLIYLSISYLVYFLSLYRVPIPMSPQKDNRFSLSKRQGPNSAQLSKTLIVVSSRKVT